MTITPLPVAPAGPNGRAGSATGKAGQPGPSGERGDFAALLDAHLAGPPPADPPTADTQAAEGLAPDSTDEPAPGSLDALLAGSLAQPGTTPVGVPAAAAGSTPDVEQDIVVTGSVAPVSPATATEPRPRLEPAAPQGGAAATVPTTGGGVASGPLPGGAAQADASAAPAIVDAQPAGAPSDGTSDGAASTADPAQAQPATGSGSPLVPGAGPAATAPVAIPVGGVTEPAPAATTSSPVLEQVTPVLSRVVSRGDGEHRMMLKLHPADLGEVHLTVTVRGDRVDVEIAAGAEAREVLREGAGQLRSLLESIGRTSGQLVVRDLGPAPTPLAGLAGGAADTGGQPASYRNGDHTDRGQQQPQHESRPAERLLDRERGVPSAPGRSHVPGGPALDVTV